MAYDFEAQLFLEDGPAIHAERARGSRSPGARKAWRELNQERRLEAIDRALKSAANDQFLDGLPIAL